MAASPATVVIEVLMKSRRDNREASIRFIFSSSGKAGQK
jgi:hypothetical protein